MFFTVAYNCRGKRNNRYVHGQKKRLTEKMKDLAAKRKRLTAKEKTSQSPRSLLCRENIVIFFCREVISLAVSLLLLICREGYSFCREVFPFSREAFPFSREVLHFAVSIFFCWEVISFTVTVVGHRSFFDWFRILNSPPWPIRRRI